MRKGKRKGEGGGWYTSLRRITNLREFNPSCGLGLAFLSGNSAGKYVINLNLNKRILFFALSFFFFFYFQEMKTTFPAFYFFCYSP